MSYNDNCVYKYNKGLLLGYKFSIVFSTESAPTCLAIQKDEHFVLGFKHDHKLCVYTEDGTVIRTMQLETPKHISVCANTGDIAVACLASGLHVVDQELVTKYRCTDIKNCTDAVYDSCGHLLICDCNRFVHVLEAVTGKHLKTIKFKDILVNILTLNHKGQLVVGTQKPEYIVFIDYLRTDKR